MTTREQILERVRKALGRTANLPEAAMPPFDPTGIMPPLATENYQARFQVEWEKVAGVCHRASTINELEAALQEILTGCGPHAVVLSRNPLLAELSLADRLRAAGKSVMTWEGAPTNAHSASLSEFQKASFQAKVGITGVDYVLAESGTLVLSSATEGSMMASLAPPVHVALYRRSQLVGSLDDLLAKLSILSNPDQLTAGRSVVLITGTSRSADIEQILIRGVHGPGEVHAILVEDTCR